MHNSWRTARQHQAVVGASKQPVLRCVHVQCCGTASSLAGRSCVAVYAHLCAMDSNVMPAATQASYSFTSPSADTCTGNRAECRHGLISSPGCEDSGLPC